MVKKGSLDQSKTGKSSKRPRFRLYCHSQTTTFFVTLNFKTMV